MLWILREGNIGIGPVMVMVEVGAICGTREVSLQPD